MKDFLKKIKKQKCAQGGRKEVKKWGLVIEEVAGHSLESLPYALRILSRGTVEMWRERAVCSRSTVSSV